MEKKKTRTKRIPAGLYLIVAAVVASLVAVAFLTSGWKQEIAMYLTVANYTGFNVDTDALYFGAVGPAATSRRNVSITNIYGEPLRVTVDVAGELRPWTSGHGVNSPQCQLHGSQKARCGWNRQTERR